jgi:hypothetical protein
MDENLITSSLFPRHTPVKCSLAREINRCEVVTVFERAAGPITDRKKGLRIIIFAGTRMLVLFEYVPKVKL